MNQGEPTDLRSWGQERERSPGGCGEAGQDPHGECTPAKCSVCRTGAGGIWRGHLGSWPLSGAGGDRTSLPCHTLPCGDGWREKLPPPGLASVITNGLSAADTVGREIIGCLGLMDELWWLLCAPSKPCSHHSRHWVTRASWL